MNDVKTIVRIKPLNQILQEFNSIGGALYAIKVQISSNERLGDYWIDFDEWNSDERLFIVRGWIETQQGGYARKLMTAMTHAIQTFTRENNVRVRHIVQIASEESRNKLTHIYREFQYEGSGIEFSRTYSP